MCFACVSRVFHVCARILHVFRVLCMCFTCFACALAGCACFSRVFRAFCMCARVFYMCVRVFGVCARVFACVFALFSVCARVFCMYARVFSCVCVRVLHLFARVFACVRACSCLRRIVNREWQKRYRKGFKCTFERGIMYACNTAKMRTAQCFFVAPQQNARSRAAFLLPR